MNACDTAIWWISYTISVRTEIFLAVFSAGRKINGATRPLTPGGWVYVRTTFFCRLLLISVVLFLVLGSVELPFVFCFWGSWISSADWAVFTYYKKACSYYTRTIKEVCSRLRKPLSYRVLLSSLLGSINNTIPRVCTYIRTYVWYVRTSASYQSCCSFDHRNHLIDKCTYNSIIALRLLQPFAHSIAILIRHTLDFPS